jgi:hypothetical protein
MKILSFDVGIKNLAYCLLNNEQIEDWGILNICIDVQCERDKCDKSATYIINNMNICTGHCKLKCYQSCKKKKIPQCNNRILKIGEKMITVFDTHTTFLDVDCVIIENQPSLKNPKMKTIQMLIYSYFLINGYSNNNSLISDIIMINARNKLKVYKGPCLNTKCPYEDNKKNKYKRNKWFAIEYCKNMIENDSNKFKDLFMNSKKKDDLSDAYLQGIYYNNTYLKK